uniref:Putative reverse transcriptase n=1 Tax=Anopheles darlingi TaxID=43151 RepID=A0A2M4CV42_ANODA
MDNPNNHLKICHWNANSISNKKLEIIHFLKSNKIDILAIAETFLKPDIKFTIPGYILHRKDRTDGCQGGVGILVRREIKHTILHDLKLATIEAIGISVTTKQGNIIITAAYHPGGNRDLKKFKSDMEKLTNRNQSYFICGDLNARHRMWNCKTANGAGKTLFELSQRGTFAIYHPQTPTHFPTCSKFSPSTIDLIITNGHHEISSPITIAELSSDHEPVTFNINHSTATKKPTTKLFDYNQANWKQFREHINREVNVQNMNHYTLDTTQQIDRKIKALTTTIQCAHNKSIPLITPGQYNIKLPENIKTMIKIKNMYRRIWQRNRRNKQAKLFYTSLEKTISEETNTVRNENWDKTLSNINSKHNNNKTLWKIVKNLKKQKQTIPPLKTNGNEILMSAEEKCETISSHFKHSHKITTNLKSAMEKTVKESAQSLKNSSQESLPPTLLIKPIEITNIIKKLKTKKSTGLDNINNKSIKNLPNKAIIQITHIFNACLNLGYFPNAWKHTKIVPIPKPGKDHSLPQNYRPISLLSCLGKIFEKTIANRINEHTSNNHIIQPTQFGFQKSLSTTHQLHRLTSNIRSNLKNKKSTGLVLLDSEKAFDTIWHNGLIYKLSKLKFPQNIVKLIDSFLKNRQNQVFIGNSSSNIYTPEAGVPQGSVLSPLLFNIYISDIPTQKKCKQYLYADDIAISSSSTISNAITKNLNNSLKKYEKYCKKWKMQINAEKSEAIFFTRRTSQSRQPNRCTKINNTDIPWKESVKYLGLHLDKKLSYKTHIYKTIQKCETHLKILYSLINRRSKLNRKNKLLLYTSIIRPTITYASAIWTSSAKSHKLKLQKIQNKFLKIILNLPPWHSTDKLHNLAEVEKIPKHILKINKKYWSDCVRNTELKKRLL